MATTNAEHYFQAYAEYSKVLRTWLVAYGIGAPVLLLTNEPLAKSRQRLGPTKMATNAECQSCILWQMKLPIGGRAPPRWLGQL